MDPFTVIITIAILIMSVVLHELSHGFMAEFLGDPTPRLQGRLTVNPLKHLDPVGSVIVPLITSFSGFTFGWARPIEWNPYNIKNKRVGELLISAAGPLSNIFLALVFGMVLRFGLMDLSKELIHICGYIVGINISLAIFNLIPIPPLDGSKILFSIIPSKFGAVRHAFESYSIFLVLILIVFLWPLLEPVIPFLFTLITGIPL